MVAELGDGGEPVAEAVFERKLSQGKHALSAALAARQRCGERIPTESGPPARQRALPAPIVRPRAHPWGMGKRSRSRIRLAARQGRPLPPPQAAAVPGEPSGLDLLVALSARQRELAEAIDAQVDVLATAGTPWPAIAAALGVTRQAARQRHRRRHPTPGDGGAGRLAS